MFNNEQTVTVKIDKEHPLNFIYFWDSQFNNKDKFKCFYI